MGDDLARIRWKSVGGLHHCRIQITYTGIRSNNDKSRSIRESLASRIQKGFLTGE